MKNDLHFQLSHLVKGKYYLLLFQMAFISSFTLANTPLGTRPELPDIQNLTGTILSEDGEALIGVNVLVKGTIIGTASDFEGKYSLEAPDDATTLVFSYTGFHTLEVEIGGRTTLDVTLRENVSQLGEVVITALGIEKSTKSLGFSTVKVDPEEVTVNRSTNFMQSLQGKVSGVNISGMATGAGGSSRISIRGQSAFAGDNQPLIVVDGIPISNSE